MSDAYSKRLVGPVTVNTATHQLVYTAPGGTVAVVKWALGYIQAGMPTLLLGIGTTATAGNRFFTKAIPATFSEELWVTLAAGETIYAITQGAGSAMTLVLSGYELTA